MIRILLYSGKKALRSDLPREKQEVAQKALSKQNSKRRGYGGENNNTPIKLEELLEFRKRTNEQWNSVIKENIRSLRLINLILENIDTINITEEELKFLHFKGDNVAGDILFKNSNLSKMKYIDTNGPVDITFDNTTLPIDMADSGVSSLILKNTIFPEELKTIPLKKIIKKLPIIYNSLKIYNVQNKFLDNWSKEEIEELKGKPFGPKEFIGPKNIWDKFLYLKKTEFGEPTKFIENNTMGSIQKPQDTFLVTLGKNYSRG